MSSIKYCFVDPDGGPLTISLTVNNGIRSAALFILWEKVNGEWSKKEKFKLITGDDGLDEKILLEKPNEIENDALAWRIHSCAQIDDANEGDFALSIHQDGTRIWNRTMTKTVPYCRDEKQHVYVNDVIFKHKVITNSRHTELWDLMEE